MFGGTLSCFYRFKDQEIVTIGAPLELAHGTLVFTRKPELTNTSKKQPLVHIDHYFGVLFELFVLKITSEKRLDAKNAYYLMVPAMVGSLFTFLTILRELRIS